MPEHHCRGRSRQIRGVLREIGLDASVRAVDLGVEEWVALSQALAPLNRAR
jgi:hypothetical protein